MPYCYNCGAAYRQGEAQCPNCGMTLTNSQPAYQNQDPVYQYENPVYQEPAVQHQSQQPVYQNPQPYQQQPAYQNPQSYQQPNYQAPPQYQNTQYQQPIIINQVYSSPVPTKKRIDKWVAFVLCFFLGYLGVHKFYEGKIGMGRLYLFTGGLFGFGWFIDTIIILCKSDPYYV